MLVRSTIVTSVFIYYYCFRMNNRPNNMNVIFSDSGRNVANGCSQLWYGIWRMDTFLDYRIKTMAASRGFLATARLSCTLRE